MRVMKIKLVKWIIWISLFNGLFISKTFGCRYTVREIGFTDLGVTPYRLYFYFNNNTSEEHILAFKKISYAALLDANVEAEMIDVNDPKNQPAMEYFYFWKIDSLPAIVILSPEGHSLVLPFQSVNQTFKEAVWTLLESVISSPIRDEILENIVEAYAIIVIAEGSNVEHNQKAQKNAASAVEEIRKIMKQMPKPVEKPPILLAIPPKLHSIEKVFLWSLGINEEGGEEPYLAVLYGRARRIGPLLRGNQITENRIFNLLTLVGADCECGLDRSWMLGTMLPLRWEKKHQTQVVKSHGFDAESPLVKAEMSQILSIAPSATGLSGKSSGSGNDRLLGYREGIVEFESKSDVPKVSLSELQALNSEESPSGFSTVLKVAIFLFGGIFLIGLVGGTFILFRARRKQP